MLQVHTDHFKLENNDKNIGRKSPNLTCKLSRILLNNLGQNEITNDIRSYF